MEKIKRGGGTLLTLAGLLSVIIAISLFITAGGSAGNFIAGTLFCLLTIALVIKNKIFAGIMFAVFTFLTMVTMLQVMYLFNLATFLVYCAPCLAFLLGTLGAFLSGVAPKFSVFAGIVAFIAYIASAVYLLLIYIGYSAIYASTIVNLVAVVLRAFVILFACVGFAKRGKKVNVEDVKAAYGAAVAMPMYEPASPVNTEPAIPVEAKPVASMYEPASPVNAEPTAPAYESATPVNEPASPSAYSPKVPEPFEPVGIVEAVEAVEPVETVEITESPEVSKAMSDNTAIENKAAEASIRAASLRKADSNVDDIFKYKKMLDAGIITPEEFAKKKKEILGL